MLKGKIDIIDEWGKTNNAENYLNFKGSGTTYLCPKMEAFRLQIIQYVEKNGLIIDYENKYLTYSFWETPIEFHDKQQFEFKEKLKILFIKSVKSRNTINEIIKGKTLSLEEELNRSEKTILDIKAAIVNLDYCLDKYFQEALIYEKK